MLDLLGCVALTASATFVTLVLANGFGTTRAERVRIGGALGAWFALVVAAAATRLLNDQAGIGAPGLGLAVVAPIVVLSVLAFRSASLHAALLAVPLPTLISLHSVRVLGILFILLYGQGRLPAPFAPAAGWGDVFIGLTALPAAWLATRPGAGARTVVLVWNALGLADLVTAIGLGVASSHSPLRLIMVEPGTDIMSTLPWLLIPGFLVPLLASTHLAMFYRLSKLRRPSARNPEVHFAA